MSSTAMFDGVRGRMIAPLMVLMNRSAEREAIDVLEPDVGDRVLGIGIGPGVGVRLLAERSMSDAAADGVASGRVVGVDPSRVQLRAARRRNRRAIDEGRVELVEATADELPFESGIFDGVVAVNSVQLWEPLEGSLAEVARVMRTGARLVALTHDWSIERMLGSSIEEWLATISELGESSGLEAMRSWRARAERGRSVAFTLTKR